MPPLDDDYLRIDVTNNVMHDVFQKNKNDLLENVITSNLDYHSDQEEILDRVMRLKGYGYLSRNRFKELREGKPKPIPLND